MTGRELQHSCLQGYCHLTSDWAHQHPVVRTGNYHRWITEHSEVDSWEFLNSEKNWINILLGFCRFLPYVMKSSKEYMGQDMATVPYRREKTHQLKSWGFVSLIPVFQPVCWVFTSVVSQWLQWKHFIKYEAYLQKEMSAWAILCCFSRCHTPIPTLYQLLDTQRYRLVLNQCQKI